MEHLAPLSIVDDRYIGDDPLLICALHMFSVGFINSGRALGTVGSVLLPQESCRVFMGGGGGFKTDQFYPALGTVAGL